MSFTGETPKKNQHHLKQTYWSMKRYDPARATLCWVYVWDMDLFRSGESHHSVAITGFLVIEKYR